MTRKANKDKFSISSFFNCPVCGKKGFSVSQRLDNIPYIGEVLETFASCKYCKYKTHDILPLTKKEYPKLQKLKVSNSKDLERRVVKSKYCQITIPEIELDISPGPGSESYISNVEGVIDRIIYSLKSIKKMNDSKNKKNRIEEKIQLLEDAKKEKNKITIIFF